MRGPCRGVEIMGMWETLPPPTLLYKVEFFSFIHRVAEEGDIKDHFPFVHNEPVVLHLSGIP